MATIDVCDFHLAQDISIQCDNPQMPGLKNTGWLINYDEIDWDGLAKEKNVVSKLALMKGRAYRCVVPGKTPFTGTNVAMVAGTYKNKFNKTAAIIVLDSGPDVCSNVIDQLANGRFVFIFENKYRGKDDKNTFEIYGLEQGLTASEMSNDKYSEDTDGGWSVTLIEEKAPSSGIFLFGESISATRASIESLEKGSEKS